MSRMLKHFVVISTSILVASGAAAADPLKERQFVNGLVSVAKVKEKLRDLVAEQQGCGSGSCWRATGYEICYYLGGLDQRLGHAIVADVRGTGSTMEVKDADLRYLRLMFQQCKLSNFQELLRVNYEPKKNVEKRINLWLGVKSR